MFFLYPLLPYLLIIAFFLGTALGLVSSYSVVRRWSLLGDIMSHATLPGVTCMFLLTQTKNISLLLMGGALSSFLSSLISFYLQKKSLYYRDSSFAVILSLFFSAGIIMLSLIQKKSINGQSLINNFIFGNIMMCANKDFLYYIPLIITIIIIFIISFRVQQILGFDYEFSLLRYKYLFFLDFFLLLCNVIIITIGLQSIGILLMGSLVISPGMNGRLLTHSYKKMMQISAFISIISFLFGIGNIFFIPSLPTGPLIALFPLAICIFIVFIKTIKGER
jgi:manganese/zinc/iron transport system permease protein